MSRWEPNARGRLAEAALALYAERGYEKVTVAEIAARAGLTERTFFRHYADKREVLFGGSDLLTDALADGIEQAPAAATPLDQVVAALEAIGERFEQADRRDLVRQRQVIVDANQELQERELVKMTRFGTALTDALRERGAAAPVAELAGQIGVAMLRVAFARWLDPAERRDLPALVRATRAELTALTAPG